MYESLAQEKWAHTKEGTEALGGKAAVHEWDEATKGKKLPKRVKKSKKEKSPAPAPAPTVRYRHTARPKD